MQAIVLTQPGGIDQLVVTAVPKPEVKPGWVRIQVKAFGVNESEVTSRKGESDPDFTFPRILGIEGVGVIDAVPAGSALNPGQQVATMMGGMGRSFDGSYAEYTLVPETQVIPFTSDLPWETLGALPEMYQTAHGSLTTGLNLQPDQTLLIRGGTSTVGLAAASLARLLGATVISTTRNPDRFELLARNGVLHPIVDTGTIADAVRGLAPNGVDAALELVGTSTLGDTIQAVRRGGIACFTGALGGQWSIEHFSPFGFIPTGVRLTTYGGDASDLPAGEFAKQLTAIKDGRLAVPIGGIYHGLAQAGQAQADLEAGHTPGKHVVVLDSPADQ